MLLPIYVLAYATAAMVPAEPRTELNRTQVRAVCLGAVGLSTEAIAAVGLTSTDAGRLVLALENQPLVQSVLGASAADARASLPRDAAQFQASAASAVRAACQAAEIPDATAATLLRAADFHRSGLPATWALASIDAPTRAALAKALIAERRSGRLGTSLDTRSRDLLAGIRNSAEVVQAEVNLDARTTSIRQAVESSR